MTSQCSVPDGDVAITRFVGADDMFLPITRMQAHRRYAFETGVQGMRTECLGSVCSFSGGYYTERHAMQCWFCISLSFNFFVKGKKEKKERKTQRRKEYSLA